ncbi:hypothetical protein JQK15_04030 [Sphingobium sp. BHU LFT2]|uniref:hypothetical protein n=1 Tax=Sphingobium sp. BHU LFT2 TaxID=2807634 RepID=UPI001BE5EE2E|nr:hypothetical protein [Sphingobium sp. BHU LFT2]MBT2242698.1 hypothetical protein [Sphingobium sp. BHU LFT2]
MDLVKITRGLGKVGLAFEALGYVVAGAKTLVRAGARRDDVEPRQELPQDKREEEDIQG